MIDFTQKIKYAILASDVAIFTVSDQQLKVLLVKAKSPLFLGLWALPGELIKPKQSLDSAAKSYVDMFIKADSKTFYMEQLYTFGNPKRDPGGRVVSVAYYGLLSPNAQELKTTKDYKEVSWFPIKSLPGLAYDHNEIIRKGLERLKAKLEYTNIIYSLMPDEFTLSELQRTYELILERKLDKRNFRKKVSSLGLVKKTGKKKTGEPYRPAQLYKFADRKIKIVEIL